MKHFQLIAGKIFRGFKEFEPHLLKWKRNGNIIVFTNGCFDLLHRGHAEYLAKASEKGDKLIVGLNSDQSVARIKGAGRPLTDEYSRAFLLASFQFVSAVVIFEEDSPLNLIKAVSPDFLVKGKDYVETEISGSEWVKTHGGKVETIDLVPGISTSALIKKVKNQ